MSTVLVVTPILIANWPAITAAVSAAISVSGFTVAQQIKSMAQNDQSRTKEIIEVEESEVLSASVASSFGLLQANRIKLQHSAKKTFLIRFGG